MAAAVTRTGSRLVLAGPTHWPASIHEESAVRPLRGVRSVTQVSLRSSEKTAVRSLDDIDVLLSKLWAIWEGQDQELP